MYTEYTKEWHVKRVRRIIETVDNLMEFGVGLEESLRNMCPYFKDYKVRKATTFRDRLLLLLNGVYKHEVCKVCLEFVGLDTSNLSVSCPCSELGCKEVYKRAKEALKRETSNVLA